MAITPRSLRHDRPLLRAARVLALATAAWIAAATLVPGGTASADSAERNGAVELDVPPPNDATVETATAEPPAWPRTADVRGEIRDGSRPGRRQPALGVRS